MAGYYYIGMQEKDIIEGCQRGERKFQEILFRKYHRKVYGICLRYAQSEPEAEDMMQEAMIRVFRKIHLYRFTGSFEGWLKSLSVHVAIEIYRKSKRLVFIESYQEVDEPHFDSSVLEKLSVDEIRKVINLMPEGYRVVFNLFAVEGYSHQEISEILGIAVGTSKSQYSRAKNYLLKLMEQYLDIHKEEKHAGI